MIFIFFEMEREFIFGTLTFRNNGAVFPPMCILAILKCGCLLTLAVLAAMSQNSRVSSNSFFSDLILTETVDLVDLYYIYSCLLKECDRAARSHSDSKISLAD